MQRNKYIFGSVLYGTNTPESDIDVVLVGKDLGESPSVDIHHYTPSEFQSYIDNHDIQALECIMSPAHLRDENAYQFTFNLDKSKLRVSISTITSNSWVKGKKKLTVLGDYDKYMGIKSVFHSIRILEFGIQIAHHGKILRFDTMNWLMVELRKLADQYEGIELWNVIDMRYRKLYNALSTAFKQECPKDLTTSNVKSQIRKAMESYNIVNADFYNELLTILKI